MLSDYQDKQLPDFLEYGWPVDYSATTPAIPIPAIAKHHTDSDSVSHMEDLITTEIVHGVLLGPFKVPPFTPWTQVSPMMVRPKRDSNKKRVIVDLSYSLGDSRNKEGPISGPTHGLHTANHYRPLPLQCSDGFSCEEH